jgi:hypothetical protein
VSTLPLGTLGEALVQEFVSTNDRRFLRQLGTERTRHLIEVATTSVQHVGGEHVEYVGFLGSFWGFDGPASANWTDTTAPTTNAGGGATSSRLA